MAEESTFRDLVLRARAGEEQAAEELLRRYEPAIRRTARARTRDEVIEARHLGGHHWVAYGWN